MEAFVGTSQALAPIRGSRAVQTAAGVRRPAPSTSFVTGGPSLMQNGTGKSNQPTANHISMNYRRRHYRGSPVYRRGYPATSSDFGSAVMASSPIFKEMFGDRVFRDVLDAAEQASRTFVPSSQVGEDDAQYWLRMEIPGFPKENIKIEVKGRTLFINGDVDRDEKTDKTTASDEAQASPEEPSAIETGSPVEDLSQSWNRSAVYTKFERTFSLPKNAAVKAIKAEVKDGVLLLTIPKLQPEEPETIPVKVL